MAAAAAAGLNRNGIRRTAFSTGDLQALSVMPAKSSPSPPDPAHASLHRYNVINVKGDCIPALHSICVPQLYGMVRGIMKLC